MHRVSHRWVSWVGAAGLALFVACALLALWAGQTWPALVLFPFAVVSGAVWFHAGVTTIDGDGVGYRSPLGSFRLRWSDMTAVEVDATLSAVVFSSGRRRIAIIGPALWTRRERSRTWNHLRWRIELLELPVHYSPRTSFLLSRGTRVPRR